MVKIKAVAFLCALQFFALPVQAALISHAMVLQVDRVSGNCGPFHTFGCDIQVGDIFLGHFDVPDSLLQMEGTNLIGSIFNFFMQIGGVVWDQNHPSDFSGFRGPLPGNPSPLNLGAPAPGFDVDDGRITGLWGDVFGQADFPFLDWQPFAGTGRFTALDNQNGVLLSGTMLIGRFGAVIPEPSTVVLLLTALSTPFVWWRRRRPGVQGLVANIAT